MDHKPFFDTLMVAQKIDVSGSFTIVSAQNKIENFISEYIWWWVRSSVSHLVNLQQLILSVMLNEGCIDEQE